jgi:hypothetical protein
MDILTSILQAPINTILILAGIAFIFLSIFDVGKGAIRLRPGKINFVPLAIGAVLLLGGIFIPTGGSATPAPTEAPSELPETRPPVEETEPPAATDTPATSAPTTPPESTATLTPKTLIDGCLSDQTWQADSIDTGAKEAVTATEGCLNAGGLRINVDPAGNIHFIAAAARDKLASGIYTTIRDTSVIEFSVTVSQLFIVYQGDPAFITFAISPPDKPMGEFGSGRFKFYVDTPGGSISYLTAGTNQVSGSKLGGQHPLFNKSYPIKLELNGLSMKVYINNARPEEVTIPDGPKVFYLGYSAATAGEVDAEIIGLTIDGQTP